MIRLSKRGLVLMCACLCVVAYVMHDQLELAEALCKERHGTFNRFAMRDHMCSNEHGYIILE
jgi:hypothetical protein